MSQPVVTFDPPGEFDPVALAVSTNRALRILLPWCRLRTSSKLTFAGNIATHALAYVEAIGFSVVAAQKGFTVAEEAISFGELIDMSTPDQHHGYLAGMLDLAKEGHSNAAKAFEAFRDVRRNVLALLEKVRPEHKTAMIDYSIDVDGQMTPMTKAFGTLHSELHEGVGALEEFANYIDIFATWWNWMKLEASAQETRTQKVIQFNYDSLRMPGVIRKWGELRQKYAVYADKIGRIQDCYPTLFVESKAATNCGAQVQEWQDYQEQRQPNRQERDHQATQVVRQRDWDSSVQKTPVVERSQAITVRKDQPELAGSVLLASDIPPAEYLSATFTKAEDLGAHKSFLILDFQCHPSRDRRFTYMKIAWKFKATHSRVPPPRVIDFAPRRSVGGQRDERRRTLYGVTAPVQFQALGASGGLEGRAEWESSKDIPHAMTITGSSRGDPADSCVWSVKENGSCATGSPPHFRIAVVLEHFEAFITSLDVKVKIEGGWWPKTFPLHVEKVVNGGISKASLERDPEWWRDALQRITGEVENGATIFSQPIVA